LEEEEEEAEVPCHSMVSGEVVVLDVKHWGLCVWTLSGKETIL
jgi:hypothetical protein